MIVKIGLVSVVMTSLTCGWEILHLRMVVKDAMEISEVSARKKTENSYYINVNLILQHIHSGLSWRILKHSKSYFDGFWFAWCLIGIDILVLWFIFFGRGHLHHHRTGLLCVLVHQQNMDGTRVTLQVHLVVLLKPWTLHKQTSSSNSNNASNIWSCSHKFHLQI